MIDNYSKHITIIALQRLHEIKLQACLRMVEMAGKVICRDSSWLNLPKRFRSGGEGDDELDMEGQTGRHNLRPHPLEYRGVQIIHARLRHRPHRGTRLTTAVYTSKALAIVSGRVLDV